MSTPNIQTSEPEPQPSRPKSRVVRAIGGLVAVTLMASGAALVESRLSGSKVKSKSAPTALSKPERTSTTSAKATSTTETSTTTPERARPDLSTFQIVGNKECQQDVKAALMLGWEKTPEYFKSVQATVGTIECVAFGRGVHADLTKAWVTVEDSERRSLGTNTGDKKLDEYNRQQNTIWLWSSLVHEGSLKVQYNASLKDHNNDPGKVPLAAWQGHDAESRAMIPQIEVLKLTGASPDVIKYAQNVIKTGYWKPQNRGAA